MSANHSNKYPPYFVLIFIVIVLSIWYEYFPHRQIDQTNKIDLVHNYTNNEKEIISQQKYKVIDILSGDTIVINNNNQNTLVKVLGVSSPNYNNKLYTDECYGKQAIEFVKDKVLNKNVILELDNNINQYDVYGRLQAYIYTDDARMLNRMLLSGGYGYEDLSNKNINYKYKDNFLAVQTFAKVNDYGLWNKDNCKDI